VFRVAPVPDSAQSLFRDQLFCSSGCIRAFLLESLETVDALETPTSNEIVRDLHDLYRGLAETLVSILDEQELDQDDLHLSKAAESSDLPDRPSSGGSEAHSYVTPGRLESPAKLEWAQWRLEG
jgi:hypothetical protein